MHWPVLVCLLLFGALLVVWVYMQDEKPVTDADLTPEPPLKTETAPRAPDRLRLTLNAAKPVKDVPEGKPVWQWDAALLARTAQENAAAFDNLRDLLSEDDWQPRHPVWQNTDLASDSHWEALGMAKSAAIAGFEQKNQDPAALQTAVELATFAKRLQGIYAWPSYYARGVELHQRACEAIAELLRTTQLPSYQLGQMQFMFERAAPSDAMLREALKSYYQFERRLIVGYRANDLWDQTAPAMATPGTWFFRPNATLRLFYKAFKGLENELADAPYARFDPLKDIIGPGGQAEGSAFSPNARGLTHAHQRLWPYGHLVDRQGLQSTRHLIVLTQFAVRRYAQDHGRLPRLLTDLVPEYFTDLPTDPYSGKPLVYDATRGLLYSVGIDVRDAGGHLTKVPLEDGAEPTVSVK